VLVVGMVRAGLVAHEPRIGLGRPVGTGMEQHLAPLPRPAQGLPLPLVDANGLRRLMHALLLHRLAFTRSSSALVHRATQPSRLAGVITSSAVRGVKRASASQQRSRARAICRSVWSTCIAPPRAHAVPSSYTTPPRRHA